MQNAYPRLERKKESLRLSVRWYREERNDTGRVREKQQREVGSRGDQLPSQEGETPKQKGLRRTLGTPPVAPLGEQG